MDLETITRAAALVAILGTAVVYGTDVFCAMVLRPALNQVDDATLVAVTGRVHGHGDKRMPVPGVLGIVAAAAATTLAVLTGEWTQAVSAGVALLLLPAWLALYLRVSAPINRQLTAAAEASQTLTNGRALQAGWDRVIVARAALQGVAVAALCLAIAA